MLDIKESITDSASFQSKKRIMSCETGSVKKPKPSISSIIIKFDDKTERVISKDQITQTQNQISFQLQ